MSYIRYHCMDSGSEEDGSSFEGAEDKSDTGGSVQDEVREGDFEERSDEDFRTQILLTLQDIKAPSAFAFSAVSSSLPNPGLYVPHHGVMGLPLTTSDAQKIIREASQSPFGRGEETIVDTTVRKSWELKPEQFSLQNPKWQGAMKKILEDVNRGLGITKGTKKVRAELNKLLLYEPGAFFKPHKDSEKADGMFATLVICLPCPHEGGKLVLTHNGEKYEFETSASSNYEFSYACWYADITHEVLPVTSGHRLVLTYNLIQQTDFEIPPYELALEHAKKLSTLLEDYNLQLEREAGDNKLPPMLLHKLEHKYTQANLRLKLLKPKDSAHVRTLTQVSTKLGFKVYLATLELVVNTCDEGMLDEYKLQMLNNMVDLNGKILTKHFSIPKGALLDPTPQDDDNPDGEEHEGPTGNEGSPATFWYKDTVAILVPPSKQLDFVFKFGFKGKLIRPLFYKLIKEFSEDPTQKSKLRQLCELALKQKPKGYRRSDVSSKPIPPFFKKALATALDEGYIDLLGEACKSRGDRILLKNARKIGHFVANNGISKLDDKLLKCMQGSSSVATMIEFLKLVKAGFSKIVPELSSAERKSFEQWLKEAIFLTVAERSALTEDDGKSLAQLSQTMDWDLFESKVTQIILNAAKVVRKAFVDELMSIAEQHPPEEQLSFISKIKQKSELNKAGHKRCSSMVGLPAKRTC
ncbi:unnamed protein product [Bemisia tabaci]|uniref:Prolyl 4-hydroxylase alpha subunit Fe(2+) 2OG dioxygenase domain-containing protein n=1 Tax=Bemisia tabaci TaxID=7038 RepID=A0A9P0ABQ1_BEMTA|nr:unnamed protein product [Bemisia tabaci]